MSNIEKENIQASPIDKILNSYRIDMVEIIDKTAEENIKEIRENSTMGKINVEVLKYCEEKIKKEYPKNFDIMKDKVYISFDVDELTQREIENELEQRDTALKTLNEILEDVKALLEITDTYEQKLEILKNYEIIDEDGLLV